MESASKQMLEALNKTLPQLHQRMRLYLPDSILGDNIIRPVMRNILLVVHKQQALPDLVPLTLEAVKDHFLKATTHS